MFSYGNPLCDKERVLAKRIAADLMHGKQDIIGIAGVITNGLRCFSHRAPAIYDDESSANERHGHSSLC